MVFISGASVYGHQFDEEVVDEDTPTAPTGPYAEAKLMSERLFLDRLPGATCLRLTSPYGSGIRRGVVRAFVDAADRGAVVVWGSGGREQDFVHVDDVALACRRALEGRASGILNVCRGEPTTMTELAALVVKCASQPVAVRTEGVDPLDGQRARYSHQRATRELGWRPTVGLREGLSGLHGRS